MLLLYILPWLCRLLTNIQCRLNALPVSSKKTGAAR